MESGSRPPSRGESVDGLQSGRWHVAKKLSPGQPGTQKLARQYGAALLCVRYRLDATGARRLTTVELVVEDALVAPRTVAVRLNFNEVQLRARLLERGATWDPGARVWRVPRRLAAALQLQGRIVDK